MKGKLTLVVTPIEELGQLKEETSSLLTRVCSDLSSNVIAVEDAKPGRRRWLHWGLPREAIEHFVLFNEHQQKQLTPKLIDDLKEGKDVYLLSDGGVPAFCDPGRALVYACHQQGIAVHITSCDNSLICAVALSGFTEGAFHFLGFPPMEKGERDAFFTKLTLCRETCVLMDTPYRLERCLNEISECFVNSKKKVCLVMDIGRETFELAWGKPSTLKERRWGKREFVCVIEGQALG